MKIQYESPLDDSVSAHELKPGQCYWIAKNGMAPYLCAQAAGKKYVVALDTGTLYEAGGFPTSRFLPCDTARVVCPDMSDR